jgi:hypothetical protein
VHLEVLAVQVETMGRLVGHRESWIGSCPARRAPATLVRPVDLVDDCEAERVHPLSGSDHGSRVACVQALVALVVPVVQVVSCPLP